MLESQRFLIRADSDAPELSDAFTIVDADTGERLGHARERVGAWTRLIRRLIRRFTLHSIIEVREGPDDALLFCIEHRLGGWSNRVDVRDAQDAFIGYFRTKTLTLGGGFRVYGYDGYPFAEVRARNFHATDFEFLTPTGISLGRVCRAIDGVDATIVNPMDRYLVSIADELREQPIAKMLLLATALAVDVVYKEAL